MTQVTPELIKQLRERTGVGVAKCKTALEETNGDIERAIESLRKAGIASAVKKESRETHEGKVEFFETDKGIALVEMNAETDFVVKNERFAKFHHEVARLAAEKAPSDLESFIAMKTSGGKTVDDARKELISVLGENIIISRVLFLAKRGSESIGVYSHMGGKIVTVVEIAGAAGQEEFARELAMHVAAESPDYLREEDVPSDIKAKEEEIAKSQIPGNKPADILNKILQGKMKAFYDQVCFLNQKYIKDNTISVSELVAARAKELGKALSVVRFIRWGVEG